MRPAARLTLLLVAFLTPACGPDDGRLRLSFSGSALGPEGDVIRRQLARFADAHPGVRVDLQVTPDSADQRHQLYVQWLNARAESPDVLQLDVIWIAEFAAAGWVLPLDRFAPDADDFVPAALEAARWNG
ncbi:MAG TPA: extracellular solute-binding protein, partial [Vicinamibacterales bacterium]|nr:extracellular solute-binding protein [Vicinamibacterales bacterium]